MLHRDIYWLGRQWAVTGYGLQIVSKKYGMRFDIEAARIWDTGLEHTFADEPWFDAGDFNTALAVARARAADNPRTFQAAAGDEK